MKIPKLILIVAFAMASEFALCAETQTDQDTEALINKLVEVSELGYGYSSRFSGRQFLPQADSGQVNTLVLGTKGPTKSGTLEAIVRQGAKAVPSLLKHLDDKRETKIKPFKGMMWTSFADEYDFNRRVRKEPPKGVNRDFRLGDHKPSSHTITVGDLCYVALGQIVNRNFYATRHQPTGGLVVSSPTHSKRLCAVARGDWQGLTEKKHRELLIQDFVKPDNRERRIGAYWRMAFYYPNAVEALVLKQLSVPTFDVMSCAAFVRGKLYPEKSAAKRKELFDEFVKSNGPASSDGILLQLFCNLYSQERDELGRIVPPLKEKYDARASLILLYGYPKDVKSTQKPYVDTWSTIDQAKFLAALTHDKSIKIDDAIYGIFKKIEDDDRLALACMKHLINKGHDDELRAYCRRRIGKNKYRTEKLKAVLARLK